MKILKKLLQRECAVSFYAQFCCFTIFKQTFIIFDSEGDPHFLTKDSLERDPTLYSKLTKRIIPTTTKEVLRPKIVYLLDEKVKISEIDILLRKICFSWSTITNYGNCKMLLINLESLFPVDIYGCKKQLDMIEKKLTAERETIGKVLKKVIDVSTLIKLIQEY